MPSETLTFDIVGNDKASPAFKRSADTAELAARGARACAIALEQQKKAADTSAGATLSLARADRILADVEKNLSGKIDKNNRELERRAKAARSSGGGAASRLIGGIGPGIGGLSARNAAILGFGGVGLGAIPALAAATGVAGVGAIAAKELIGTKALQGPLFQAAQNAKKAFGSAFTDAAKGLEGPLRSIFKQIPAFVQSITPALKQIFAAVGPLLGPLVHGFESLVKGILPGFVALMKAAGPAVSVVAKLLGTIGQNLGGVFKSFATVIKPASVLLAAIGGVAAGLLPVIGKLVAIFANALAPVFSTLAGVLKSIEPVFVIIGGVIADLAKAVLGDLLSAFTAVAKILIAVAPALASFATAIKGVFDVLENSGVFAILGNALEKLAGPLAVLIDALVKSLVPVLPIVIKLVSQFASLLAGALGAALVDIVTGLTAVVKALPVLVPLLLGVVAAVKLWAVAQGILNIVLDANPIGLIVIAIGLLVVAIVELVKHWNTVWTWIKNIGLAAWHWLYGNVIHPLIVFFTKTIPTAFDIFKNAVAIAWDGIKLIFFHGVKFIVDLMAHLPGPLGAPFKAAQKSINATLSDTEADIRKHIANIQHDWDKLHGEKVTFTFATSFVASHGGAVNVGGKFGYAAGTSGASPGWAWVGERGPELVRMRGGETVIPNHALGGYAAGAFNITDLFRPSGAAFDRQLTRGFAHDTASYVLNAIRQMVLSGGGAGPAGAGVARWRGTALRALALLGLPSGDVGTVLAQMATESGGNPYAVNKWDSNWARGTPSVGLMQVIGPTFAAYAGPFRRTLPSAYGVSENGLANIYAGINYAIHRYGNPGWLSVLGQGHGYDHGGWLRPGLTLAYNGTGKPERVGGDAQVVLEVTGGSSELDQLFMTWLQRRVRIKGGDPAMFEKKVAFA